MIVKEIVLAIDPALRRIEEILLWKNKLKTCGVFTVCHFLFWLFQNFNIRTYCIISCVALGFHILDAYRTKKRRELYRIQQAKPNIIENISSLGRYILILHEKLEAVWIKLAKIKQRNRVQYFLALFVFWSMMTIIGIKIKGVYLAYMTFWIVFFLPPFFHYDVPRRMLCKALPLLEQLDQSMKYKRRSVLDKKELLVDVRLPASDAIDEEVENEYLESFRLNDIEKMQMRERKVFERLQDDEDDDDDDDTAEEGDEEDIEGEEEQELEMEANNEENSKFYLKKSVIATATVSHHRTKAATKDDDDDDEDGLNSFLPDETTLPNISDVLEDYFPKDQLDSKGQQPRVLRKRASKTRPSLIDYYASNIMTAVAGSAAGQPRTAFTKQNENDIDETFDFLDDYSEEDK